MAFTLTGCICQASVARAPRPAHARPHDVAFPKAPLTDPRSPRRIASEWFACEKLIGDADFEGIACIPEAVESANQGSHPTTCKFPEQSGRLKTGPKCSAKLSRFYQADSQLGESGILSLVYNAHSPHPTSQRSGSARWSAPQVGWMCPLAGMLGRAVTSVNRHAERKMDYCSFSYSALACFRMGMSASASFQRVRNS